jgi:hypothetical protein
VSQGGESFFGRIRNRLKRDSPAHFEPAESELTFARGFANFHSSAHWNLWATPSFLQVYSKAITNEALIFPELFVRQLESDFGYSIFPLRRGECFDGERLDLVLDPSSQGGAHTGSAFGPLGVSLSPDSIYNEYSGETGFWYRVLSLHETVNVWTGRLAGGWIWADGSELWQGKSPFPNMADFVILEEIGYNRSARSQKDRVINDPTVLLFYRIQQEFGWTAFQGLFTLVRRHGIRDWHAFGEPLRTAITILFLSRAAGKDLLPEFQGAGIAISRESYSQAESIFPL